MTDIAIWFDANNNAIGTRAFDPLGVPDPVSVVCDKPPTVAFRAVVVCGHFREREVRRYIKVNDIWGEAAN